jgi:hypothetical protein
VWSIKSQPFALRRALASRSRLESYASRSRLESYASRSRLDPRQAAMRDAALGAPRALLALALLLFAGSARASPATVE